MNAARHLAPVPPAGLSEQGEQQVKAQFVWADRSTVDAYVEAASEPVLACRSGGHSFPVTRTSFTLDRFDENLGLFVSEQRCRCCRSACRTTWYEAIKIGRGGRGGYRFQEVGCELTGYKPNPETGEVYTSSPGAGRLRRRDVRSSIATQALSTMTLVELRRALASGRRV